MRKRGHDVFLFVGEAQYAFIQSQQLSSEINVVEIRGDYDGENNWAPGTKATLKERAESISGKWLSTLRVLYREMRLRLKRSRTVIVSHPLNFAARLLQEKELVPHATVVCSCRYGVTRCTGRRALFIGSG